MNASTEEFRGRIYGGEGIWTLDLAMHYACGPGGLSGEAIYTWPESYLATHIVPKGGRLTLSRDLERIVANLLARGWIERRERTLQVPADTDSWSMFYGTPAHRLTLVTYHATERGRAEHARRSP